MNTFDEKFLSYKEKLDMTIEAGKLLGIGDYIFDSGVKEERDKSWYTFVGFREIKQRMDNEIKYYLIGILQSREGIEQEMALQLILEYFQNNQSIARLSRN